MNQHLTLLRAVVEISPILALRSLFHWEGEYSSEAGGLRTIHETETRSAIYAGESSSPCVTATFTGESVDLQVNAALPDDLNYCLAALGLGRGKSPATLRMDSENLHDRVLTVDAAWVLLRRLRLDAPDVDGAKAASDIIQLANDWNLVRLEHFNNGESPALERRDSELRQRAATLCATLPLQEVSFRPDPRGAALELRFRGSHDFSLAPLRFDWPFGAPQQTEAPAGKRAAGAKYAVTPTTVGDDVLGALSAVTTTDREVRITARLSPKLYAKVNEVLRALGGEWHTGRQAHVFPEPAQPLLDKLLLAGHIYLPKDFEFFETQAAEVAAVIELAGLVPGMRVLEPEAGRGALAIAAARHVGKKNVTVFELMPANVKELQQLGFDIAGPQDFLQVQPEPGFDAVVMNPPFSGGRDAAHVLHAMKFLRPGGRLVAITSTSWQERGTAAAAAFREMLAKHEAEVRAIPRGAFKAAGTDVATALIAFNVADQAPALVKTIAPVATEQLAFF